MKTDTFNYVPSFLGKLGFLFGGIGEIAMMERFPGLKVVLMDMKEMATEAQAYVDAAGMGAQVSTTGVNMFTEEWPKVADGHFFSNVFHDWSDETNRLIAKRSFDALPSGGRIFLNEILMDDEGTGPFPAALLLRPVAGWPLQARRSVRRPGVPAAPRRGGSPRSARAPHTAADVLAGPSARR